MADKHDEQLLGFSNLDKIFPIIDVVDDLNSDSTNRPLSAKQGKTLKEMINGITSFNYEIVTELPVVGQKGIIYLILNSASTEENNVYDEYLYVNNKYEKLGSFTTQIDLSQIRDELFFDLDISFLEAGWKGTISVDKYNEILNAIKSDKLIRVLGVLAFATSDESSISIYINLIEIAGWFIINKTGAYYFLPDTFTLERSSYGSFPIDGFRYIFEDKSLIKLINFKIVDGDAMSVNIIDYEKTSEAITFKCITGENFYYDCTLKDGSDAINFTANHFYANNNDPGIIGIDYKQNGQNYPVQLDESHNAFVSIPENRYDLDMSLFSNNTGTISTDKYNEIANAIKDGKFIYISNSLVNGTANDSSITISIMGEIGMSLFIKNTGEYILIPKSITLTPGRYKLKTPFAYVFEYEEYLKYVVDSIYYIDNKDNRYTVVIIKDYNKTSDSISFTLVLSNLYYYKCLIDLTITSRYDLSIDESGYIYPTENGDDAGVIGLGYTQNDKNYPLQINERGQAFVNVPWSGSTYNNATQISDGLMSKEDKTKLDGFTGSTTKILTQSEYDTLTNKDENTVYFIKG